MQFRHRCIASVYCLCVMSLWAKLYCVALGIFSFLHRQVNVLVEMLQRGAKAARRLAGTSGAIMSRYAQAVARILFGHKLITSKPSPLQERKH